MCDERTLPDTAMFSDHDEFFSCTAVVLRMSLVLLLADQSDTVRCKFISITDP